MDKNYWKTDNENGYKYQLLAFRNALSLILSHKEKCVELKGIPWGIIEEVIDQEKITYDLDRVYEPDNYLNYSVNIYSVDTDECLYCIKGNCISGDVSIWDENY